MAVAKTVFPEKSGAGQCPVSFFAHASRLAETLHGETVRILSEQSKTFQDIARVLLPETYTQCPNLAQMAVARAARKVFSKDEVEKIRERNRQIAVKRGGLACHPFEQSNAELEPSVVKKVAWSPEEKEDLIAMASGKKYAYTGGWHNGKPCFSYIAYELNVRYHNSIAVRTPNACSRKYKRELSQRTKGARMAE